MTSFIKTKQKWFIYEFLLFVAATMVMLASALICYPRMSYDQSMLYGAQDENLKDFSEKEGIMWR